MAVSYQSSVKSRRKNKNFSFERSAEKTQNRLTKDEAMLSKKDRISRNLMHSSPWFNSIMDPLTGADIKIPDETGVPTGTMQMVFKHALTATSTGYAGMQIVCPYPNDQPSGTSVGCNYQIIKGTTPGPNTIVWAGSPTEADGTCASFPGMDTLKSFSRGVRVVSASLTIQPEMSGLNDQGEMIAYQIPFSYEFPVAGSYQISDYANIYQCAAVPVNTHRAAISRWYPYYREQSNYKSFIDPNHIVVGNGDAECPYWTFGIAAHGLVANSALMAQVVINYEYLPSQNVLNIVDASPSVADSTDHELTLKFVQDEPKSGSLPTKEVSRSPAAANPSQEEGADSTGFGMFSEVFKELLEDTISEIPVVGGALRNQVKKLL